MNDKGYVCGETSDETQLRMLENVKKGPEWKKIYKESIQKYCNYLKDGICNRGKNLCNACVVCELYKK